MSTTESLADLADRIGHSEHCVSVAHETLQAAGYPQWDAALAKVQEALADGDVTCCCEEIDFPAAVCPDREAMKEHGPHHIEGTLRDWCPGITTFEAQKAAADAPSHVRNHCPALPVGCVRCTAPATVRAAIAASQGLPPGAGPAHLDGCAEQGGIGACAAGCPRPAAIAAATWVHDLDDFPVNWSCSKLRA